MKCRSPLLLITCACLLLAQPNAGRAHDWRLGAHPLEQADIDTVLQDVATLADTAKATGLLLESDPGSSVIVTVFDLAYATGQSDLLTVTLERCLVAYDALTRGVVAEDGSFRDGADPLLWVGRILPEDVAAIADRRAEFDTVFADLGALAK